MKKTTSIDVAKLAGVSQTTVSAVLSNNSRIRIAPETKTRVIECAKELSYGPYSQKNSAGCLPLVAVFIPTLENPYYANLINHLQNELYLREMSMLLCCTDNDERKEYQLLLQAKSTDLKGVLYGFTPTNSEHIKQYFADVPCVVIGETKNDDLITIDLDSHKAGFMAASFLYGLGHRRIAFVTENPEKVSLSRKKRMEGIYEFADSLSGSDKAIIHTISAENSENGYRLGEVLSSRFPEVTAVIGVNDRLAVGVMNALQDSGRKIPEEISVMGFDNIEMSQSVTPSLTTIDHCLKERCRQAVEVLTNGCSTYRITYSPVLIERQSTGPCDMKGGTK